MQKFSTWRWHAHGRASHPHGWRYHGSTRKLSSFEGRGGGVNQVLGLVLHPFLIVELHILLVLPEKCEKIQILFDFGWSVENGPD